MNASILTIGDEILIGQVLDTNSAWIARKLNEIGIKVEMMLSIGDTREQITESLNTLLEISDFIFITGGLGPTNDDITKKVLSEYFDTQLIFNDEIYKNIERRFSKLGIKINSSDHDQALVPENATILSNDQGTAPGMMFEKNGKFVFSMPGVPVEMKYIFERHIENFLRKNFIKSGIIHKTLVIVRLGESKLAEIIRDWENSLPEFIRLAYLPSYGYIRLRLSSYSYHAGIDDIMQQKLLELKKIIPENIIAEKDSNLETLLSELLISKGKTMSTAESCTGGKIASMITQIPGSSNFFTGSVISYSNDVKTNILKVNKEDILNYGAVSEQVVEQMARNTRELLNTDYAVATSGIAGPGGGSEEKPVGTVWIAVASKQKIISKKYLFSNDRTVNIIRASNAGLLMLIDEINKEGN